MEQDLKVRKALVWRVLNSLSKVRPSNLLQLSLCHATVDQPAGVSGGFYTRPARTQQEGSIQEDEAILGSWPLGWSCGSQPTGSGREDVPNEHPWTLEKLDNWRLWWKLI